MSVLDRDTLKLIQETAVKAEASKDKVSIIALPGETGGAYGVVGPDGQLAVRLPLPPPRHHVLGSVEDVPEAVAYYHKEGKDGATPAIVWYSREGVTIVLDDSNESRRLDRVVCPLKRTPAFAWLADKAASDWFEHKDFIRLLRVTLVDCLTESSAALAKQIKLFSFKETANGYSRQELGRESLGRDIESEISADAGPLPETVNLAVRLYTDPALTSRMNIVCAFDTRPKDNTFNLTPIAGEIENAIDKQLDALRERFQAAPGTVVFYGTP